MIYYREENEFIDNTFQDYQWTAPLIQNPDQLEEYLRAKSIVGRTIKGFRAIGYGYNLVTGDIEDQVYRRLNGTLPDHELHAASNYDNIDPAFPIYRHAELSEPFIIVFSDGDRLEINFNGDSEVHIGLNSIPFEIKPGTNLNNFDANILFSCCIGCKIQAIEIIRRDSPHDGWPSMYGEEWKKQQEFIDKIILRLNDGNGLCFEALFDFGDVYVEDSNNKLITIPFDELQPGLYDDDRR